MSDGTSERGAGHGQDLLDETQVGAGLVATGRAPPTLSARAATLSAVGEFENGQILGGRYEMRTRLGAGGMGEVWRATDRKLDVEVALKCLHPLLSADAANLDLLRREVRAAREVLSPHVCRIFDLVEIDGREFVSMEFIDGQTLLRYLDEHGPLDLPDAVGIATQFLAGLEAIHQAGLLHRDLKPGNVMITRTGRVVVMDFGLAWSVAPSAAADSASSRHRIAGTRGYMSPEQERGGPMDPRSDIYSAAVTIAEMIALRRDRDATRAVPLELPGVAMAASAVARTGSGSCATPRVGAGAGSRP